MDDEGKEPNRAVRVVGLVKSVTWGQTWQKTGGQKHTVGLAVVEAGTLTGLNLITEREERKLASEPSWKECRVRFAFLFAFFSFGSRPA